MYFLFCSVILRFNINLLPTGLEMKISHPAIIWYKCSLIYILPFFKINLNLDLYPPNFITTHLKKVVKPVMFQHSLISK